MNYFYTYWHPEVIVTKLEALTAKEDNKTMTHYQLMTDIYEVVNSAHEAIYKTRICNTPNVNFGVDDGLVGCRLSLGGDGVYISRYVGIAHCTLENPCSFEELIRAAFQSMKPIFTVAMKSDSKKEEQFAIALRDGFESKGLL